MKYDLVRPCAHCPFRTDKEGYIRGARAEEIASSLIRGATFPCHKTTISVDEEEGMDEEGMDMVATRDSQFCAGALIMLEHMEQPNQIMRIAERLAMYEPSKLDMTSPVFEDADDFVRHHYDAQLAGRS